MGSPSLGDFTMRCRVRGVEVLAGPGVFVPTPDADLFVDLSLDWIGRQEAPTIVELGTGCGAIALALAKGRPDAAVYATDLAAVAVRSARDNAKRLGLQRVHFLQGSVLDPLPSGLLGQADAIIANLPFYPPDGYASIGAVPRGTTQGSGKDGLDLLRELARDAHRFLRPGGLLVLQMFTAQWELFSRELKELDIDLGLRAFRAGSGFARLSSLPRRRTSHPRPGRLWHYSAVFARRGRRGASVDPGLSWMDKLAMLLRIWRIAAQIQLALWRRPLPEVVRALDTPGTEPRTSVALLNRAMSRGLRVGPWRPRCLLRSLVLYRMLRAQGDPAELVIGLPHRPTSRDAHAWVEMAGRDVGPAPGRSGYEELTRYPRDRRQPSTSAQ